MPTFSYKISFKTLWIKRVSHYPGCFGLDNSVKYNHEEDQRLVCGLQYPLPSFKNVITCILWVSSI